MCNNYRTVIDKMNEFISWNRNRFYNQVVKNWRPVCTRGYYSVAGPELMVYGPYISIACSFAYDTGFPHETHEYKTFCYNMKTKKFVTLSEASGWTNEELHEIILNADFDDGFNLSKDRQDLSIEEIEGLNFQILKNGKIEILFSDYVLDRYSHTYVIERKK